LYSQTDTFVLKQPLLFLNNFKKPLTKELVLNCRKMTDFGVRIFLSESLKKYDIVKLELHRFGSNTMDDDMIAYKEFKPPEKEYQKKYASKNELNLFLFIPENDGYFTSDFELNTLLFKPSNYINDVFCTYKIKENNSYYLVVKGYKNMGRVNKFGEIIYDKGKELSPRSIVFKNRE
jgi:hypothetical protein